MDIAVMIEGQNGLDWPRWMRVTRAVEALEFAGLYRSDHFTNASPPDLDSLELWVSLAWLASHTQRIEFGPLVSPVSFRHPALTARMAAAMDDLSGGRLRLGLGAGWQEREHTHFGFDLLDAGPRFARFEEGLQVVLRLLREDGPVTFDGAYFSLRDATLLPRPRRAGGPPIVIGGNGPKRTLPLAARYADEWNAVFVAPERFTELSARLDGLVQQAGRSPSDVRRTLMAGVVLGRDDAEVQRRLGGRSPDDLRARGVLVGTGGEIAEGLNRFADVGVQRIMLQWLELDDLDGLEYLARAALPAGAVAA